VLTSSAKKRTLNNYIRKFASQHQRSRIAQTWILSPKSDPTDIAGFFSLSAAQIQIEEAPAEITKRLPRYPIPAARIAQLARDTRYKGNRVGPILLASALNQVLLSSETMGIRVVIVDALNERAATFYESFGFSRLPQRSLSLVATLANVAETKKP
jgi:ribosomal protein S18 acetylase RimI-like enzyme